VAVRSAVAEALNIASRVADAATDVAPEIVEPAPGEATCRATRRGRGGGDWEPVSWDVDEEPRAIERALAPPSDGDV
jgi:hypothetical protein